MALEESDITTIAQIVNDAIAKGNGNKGNGDGNGGGGNDGDDIQRIKDEDAKRKASEAALKSAMGFNLTRDAFLNDNKAHLPESIGTVIKGLAGRQYKSEREEADNYRKIILDEVFETQKNIDIMPESAKSRISAYKALADSDRVEKAGEYFELVDTFLTLKKGIAQKEFNKNGTGNGEKDAYAQKFADLGKKFEK